MTSSVASPDAFLICKSADGADAIVVITEWEDYKYLNWESIAKNMRSPGWVFDTRFILSCERIKKAGLNLWSVGNGSYN